MPAVQLSAGVVEYAEQGSGPPVVLLHGVMMDEAQWDAVLPLLPPGFRYLRPVLPLGSHRRPMRADADLSLDGQVRLVAELLDALDLTGVTLVCSDWGGGLLLTARGLDRRVGRLVVFPCEAFDNFPPGLPGRFAVLSCRLPGGLLLGARGLRRRRLRRLPMLMGWMARRPLDDALVRRWTEPLLADPLVRRDLVRYATAPVDRARCVADTEALAGFGGDALVLWSAGDRVMPPAHGRRLAEILPRGRLVEVPDAYVLSMLDQPGLVAGELGRFLVAARTGG